MAKKRKTTAKKKSAPKKQSKTSKSDETFECFYCGGLVHDWNWRCPHCGKLFNSGKRAVALFITVIIISALIGTYPMWAPKPEEPPYPLKIVRVTPVHGNTTAVLYAQPTVEFDLWHALNISIDRKSCERAFSIEPSINGTLYWGGPEYGLHFMQYFPNNVGKWDEWLQPNTKYWINVTTECRDVKGNHLDKEWNSWFITGSE